MIPRNSNTAQKSMKKSQRKLKNKKNYKNCTRSLMRVCQAQNKEEVLKKVKNFHKVYH